MRRMVLAFSAIAALAAFSSNAQAGHTAAEVHMFFGNGNVGGPGAATFTPGENPVADALPGDTVWFPVFVRVLAGDVGGQLAGYSIDVMTDTGLLANVSGSSASRNSVFGGAGGNGATDGSNVQVAHVSLPPGTRTSIHRNMFEQTNGQNFIAPGNTAHVGYVAITMSPLATGTVPLYMAVGSSLFGLDTVGAITVGFGWDNALPGGIDTYRYQNPNVDVIGTTAGHTSVMADASIRIVPEPATFGLLGLGLLAIRRRRNA